MNSNIQNNNLYKHAARLCKFMKSMADLQQRRKLTRIRLSFNDDEFPHPDMDDEERFNSYNYLISQEICMTVMSFCRADRHFRSESFGKPDNSIHIRFIMKKTDEEKITFDKSNILNKEVKVFIHVKDNETDYNDDILDFVCKYIHRNFEQLHLTNKEEYKKIVDSEKYTREEIRKIYNLKNY